MKLRKYQQEFVDAVLAKPAPRMLGVLPTGTGKTICFAEIARRLNLKTLILAHRDELIRQACDKVASVWRDAEIGVVKAKENEMDRQITVASIQSLHRKRLFTLPEQRLVITDEAHHAAAPSYRRVYHRLGLLDESPDDDPLPILHCDAIHLGVTATPNRTDKAGLLPIFDTIVFERKLFDFVPEFLSDLRLRGINASLDFDNIKTSRLTKDFDERQLSEMMASQQVNAHIYRAYDDFAADRTRTLVFCVDRNHAAALYDHFIEKGIPCGYLDYLTHPGERKATLDDFRTGQIRVLFNVMLLTEGFDLPEIDCILIARPTKSPLLLTQMIGRGTRRAEGKADCMVIDVAQWQRGASAISVASLFNLDPSKLDDDRTLSEMVDALNQFGTDSGKAAPLREGPEYQVEVVLDSVFAILDNFKPKFRWHYDQATEKQLQYLEIQLDAIGERMPQGLTKGQAWAMLEFIFNTTPATEKQKVFLHGLGVAFDEDITKIEASDLIDETLQARREAEKVRYV